MQDSTQIQCPSCGAINRADPRISAQTRYCRQCGKPLLRADSFPPAPRPGDNGFATAGVICGILMCVPICCVLAIIFGVIGLSRANTGRVGGRGMAFLGIALGSLGFVLWTVGLLIAFASASHIADIMVAESYLRPIGFACMEYAEGHDGFYPPDLGTLATTRHLSPQMFIIPGKGKVAPASLPLERLADWVNANSDFDYEGAGLTIHSSPDSAVASENAAFAVGDRVAAIFVNGRTRMVRIEDLQADLERNRAGDSQ